MASLHLSSRYGVLKVQDTFDHEHKRQQNKNKKSNEKEKESSSSSENAKKRARKKKRQQQAANDELKGMAFMQKKTGSSKQANPAGTTKAPQAEKDVSHDGDKHNNHKQQPSHSWKNKDEELLDSQFEQDLHKALLESKLLQEEQQTFQDEVGCVIVEEKEDKEDKEEGNRKDRRKHLQKKEKQHAMSLREFHSTAPSAGVGLDDISAVSPINNAHTSPVPATNNVAPKNDQEFFNQIEDEAVTIVKKEKNSKQKKKKKKEKDVIEMEIEVEDEGEVIRKLQYEDELQKKDSEIKEMKMVFKTLRDELTQVRKRNKQLCVILAQGEMKDKADVLKQVEELTVVKDELTEEVMGLHGALEQERSKVSSLKAELVKLQEKKK